MLYPILLLSLSTVLVLNHHDYNNIPLSYPSIPNPSMEISNRNIFRSIQSSATTSPVITCANIHPQLKDNDMQIKLTSSALPVVDIRTVALLVTFKTVPQIGTKIHLVLHHSLLPNQRQVEITVVYPVVHTMTPTFMVVLSVLFPCTTYVHNARLTLKPPVGCDINLAIVNPPTLVKPYKFAFQYATLIHEYIISQAQSKDLFIDIKSISSVFEDAYTVIMKSDLLDLQSKHLFVPPLVTDMRNQVYLPEYQPSNMELGCLAQFMTLLSREFTCSLRMLLYTDSLDHSVFHILPNTYTSLSYFETLDQFRFLGRMIGLAIINRRPLAILFSKRILDAILTTPSPSWTTLTQMFGYVFGEQAQINAQTRALCFGVWDIVPLPKLQVFTTDELAWLISGQTFVKVNDLKRWIGYTSYTVEYSSLVRWFWSYCMKLSQQKLHALLELITNSPHLPALGFDGYTSKCILVTGSMIDGVDEVRPYGVYLHDLYHLVVPSYSSKQVLIDQFNLVLSC